jgi:hypothetical protein
VETWYYGISILIGKDTGKLNGSLSAMQEHHKRHQTASQDEKLSVNLIAGILILVLPASKTIRK